MDLCEYLQVMLLMRDVRTCKQAPSSGSTDLFDTTHTAWPPSDFDWSLSDETRGGVLQADLWDDAAEALKRMFGERVGRWCAAAAEIAAGETDLVADRIRGQKEEPAQLFVARKRRLIASRMIASQAVCRVAEALRHPVMCVYC